MSSLLVALGSIAFFLAIFFSQPLPESTRDDPEVFRAPEFSSLFPGQIRPTASETDPQFETGRTPQQESPQPERVHPNRIFAFVPLRPRVPVDTLKTQLNKLDGILPEWLDVSEDGTEIIQNYSEARALIADYMEANGTEQTILPLVRGLRGVFDRSVYPALVRAMVRETTAEGYSGLCLDLSGLPLTLREDRVALLQDLASAFANSGKQTCVIIDHLQEQWPVAEINEAADLIVVLPFDQPWSGDIPASIAPYDRFATETVGVLSKFDMDKVVLGLGNRGVDWKSGTPVPDFIPFAEIARLSGLHDKSIDFDTGSLTPSLRYTDLDGTLHQIFFTDATTAYNQLVTLKSGPLGGVAIWPLGGEDPGIWALFEAGQTLPPEEMLDTVDVTNYVGQQGQGVFLTVFGTPQAGRRIITTDADSGLIVNQKYTTLPQTYTVAHWAGDARNRVALTFDDGPDDIYTPRVLDILKEQNVTASFFLIGEKALTRQGLVRRIIDEGHSIGVHTFTHPNISMVSDTRLALEVNSTQELLAYITGRNTILFRAPYGEDSEPETLAQAEPMAELTTDGYINVGVQIDTRDWSRPGVEEIVSSVRKAAIKYGGGIILLHDAGGDRSQTIAALPQIIATLKDEGFVFSSLEDLLGVSVDEIMPPVDTDAKSNMFKHWIQVVGFGWSQYVIGLLPYIFGGIIVLGVSRSVLIVFFALIRRRHEPETALPPPAVTVLIPAYNEGEVVLKTIKAVLDSDFPDIKVIVIDDGSSDDTYDIVKTAYGDNPAVTLLHQENQGKAIALNYGCSKATSDILIAIDADTLILPTAITRMVRHFEDPKVGAVAGNTKVGNRVNMLTRLQAVEYITSQNLDRRAFERFNAILVVPGSIGAWQRAAVIEAGGYTLQTLAEDADMTVAIILQGYRVIYEERAIAMTEAPETLKQLMGQRLRWTLGIMQVAWKHRRAVRERSGIGLVAIPNILVFGTLLPLFAPLADIVFVIALGRFARNVVQHPIMVWADFSPVLFAVYAIYLLSDLILSAIAFLLEPKEDKRLLLLVLIQRFFYRQILYVAVIRSLWHALTGRLSGWTKVTRTADVNLPANRRTRSARRHMAIERISPKLAVSPKTPGIPLPSETLTQPDNQGADS